MVVAVLLLAFLAAEDPNAVFARATKALAEGEYAAAERDLRALLDQSPSSVSVLGNLGVIYSRTNRTAAAVEMYTRALRVRPGEPGLLLNLGLVHFKQESYAEALPYFEKVVAADPAHRQARELHATCLLYTGQPEEAVRKLGAMAAESPREPSLLFLLAVGYRKTGEPEKARRSLDELLRSAVPAQAQFLAGKARYGAEDFDSALAAFRAAREADPALPGIDREIGKTHISRRENEAAEQSLREALRHDPMDAEAAYFLGSMLVQLDRTEEAEPHLRQAVRARPGFWGAHYYLGRARLKDGDTDLAIEHLEQAARLNPDEASIFYQLARAYQTAGRDEESRKALARLKELRAQ